MDVANIQCVINFEFPVELMRYIHRVGRTARAGNAGVSFTICDDKESKKLKKLMRKYNEKPVLVKIDKLGVVQTIKQVKKFSKTIQQVLDEEKWERDLLRTERDL